MSIISKETFDKFTEEEKRKVRELNKELSTIRNENGDKYHYLTGSLDNLDALFGKENIQPKPKIKTWNDIKEGEVIQEIQENFNDLGAHCYIDCNYEGYIPSKIINKMIATAKIAKLIELGYGGMVSDEEWKDNNINKYCIIWGSETNKCRYIDVCYAVHFIAFHTSAQREEFMSYPENVKLIEQYYML